MAEPIVSIIMPAYNAQKFIQQTIDSVKNQIFTQWELIITNDGSTDDTLNIIQENINSDSRICVITQINAKQAAARNSAIKKARGELLAFIDADDTWMPNKLSIQTGVFSANKDVDVVYSGGAMVYSDGRSSTRYPTEFGLFEGKEMYQKLYRSNIIPNLSVVFRKKWIYNIGLQDESAELVGCEDWEYWIRLAKAGCVFLGLNMDLFNYRVHSESMSNNLVQMKRAELFALYKNLESSEFKKTFAKERIGSLAADLIPKMFINGKREQAISVSALLMRINHNIRFTILYWYLKIIKPHNYRIVEWLLDPKKKIKEGR
ncbi:MAG TPA: glycosyltransferase [Puia sp.]|nr:glycosyltransferase [Puia sp.]